MISRRESLKVFASGAAMGLTGAVIVSTTSCVPTAAPAAEADPLLALIREYRAQLAIYNASGDLDDDELDALAAATIDPPWYRLCDECPVPSTMEGAIEGVRLIERDLREIGTGSFHQSVLAAVIAFFDRHATDGS